MSYKVIERRRLPSAPDAETLPMHQLSLWWLSFVIDGEFAGVAIVAGTSFPMAVQVASLLGCNPGGEASGTEIPEGIEVDEEYRCRLLSEAEALNVEAMSLAQWAAKEGA